MMQFMKVLWRLEVGGWRLEVGAEARVGGGAGAEIGAGVGVWSVYVILSPAKMRDAIPSKDVAWAGV